MSDASLNSLDDLFLPCLQQEDSEIDPDNTPFAHYTTAEAAVKIIKSSEIWLRNVQLMNDYSEIVYGLNLMAGAWGSPEGESFKQAADAYFSGVIDVLDWSLGWQKKAWPALDHHAACFSIHDFAENQSGRLSMWRAYGNVALVFRLSKETLEANATNPLGVYLWKVKYLNSINAKKILVCAEKTINQHCGFVRGLDQEKFMRAITQMVYSVALTTKHPGFVEEKEVRVYFRPTEKPGSALAKVRRIECIKGFPQMIYPLSLQGNRENSLEGIDLQSILDRIIIGPTPYPQVMRDTFVELLNSVGVTDVPNKVIVSDIPLR